MRVAVAGGTGVLGRYVVEAARNAGHDAVVLSRRAGTDLTTGAADAGALDGVEVIVDATNPKSQSRGKATAFFRAVTANLQAAGSAAGARRLITVSIVNIDRLQGNPYYQAKLAHESAAREGPLPATIVRATQFHEFPLQVMQRLRVGPLAFMPRFKVQTVAARSLGELIVEVASDPPDQDTIDVAGPGVADLFDLARKVAAHQGGRNGTPTRVVALPLPGRTAKLMRDGALTPDGSPRIVGPRFDDWLSGGDVNAVGSPAKG